MANIAQVVNVLQAMILTSGDKMLLTPTYHVFNMYKVHQNAIYIPSEVVTARMRPADGVCAQVPQVSATASKSEDGKIHISLANTSTDKVEKVTIDCNIQAKEVTATILTADHPQEHNTFAKPENVKPEEFKKLKQNGKQITLTMPPLSIVTIEID